MKKLAVSLVAITTLITGLITAAPAMAAVDPSCTVTYGINGLTPGVDYQVRVSAVNAAGYSSFLEGTFTTATVKPSAPLNLEASNVTPNGLTLGWSLPETNGGSAPTALRVSNKNKTTVVLGWAPSQVTDGSKVRNYTVSYSVDQGETWTTVRKANSASTTLTVTGLRSATSYWFKVTATNDVGESEAQQNPLVVVSK